MAPTAVIEVSTTCKTVLDAKACQPSFIASDGNANGIPIASDGNANGTPVATIGQIVALHHPERDDKMKEPPATIDQLIDKFDLDYEIAADLMSLRGTEIVVIADDSGSMKSKSTMRGVPEVKTRWHELQYTLTKLLDILLFVDCDGGFELQFLNSNAAPTAIHSAGDLNDVWRWASPRGGTPLVGRTRQFTNTKPGADRILMVMTDGLPSDGSFDTLRQTVRAKRSNVYMNFMMCTSDDEVVDRYEDSVDAIPGVDVHDDFQSEKEQVEACGNRLSYNAYLAKCVLGAKFAKYDELDERKLGSNGPACACSIM